jgi:hypothetical protein
MKIKFKTIKILVSILFIAVIVGIVFWIDSKSHDYKPLNKYDALKICNDKAKACGDGRLSVEASYRHKCSEFFNYAKTPEEILSFANNLC